VIHERIVIGVIKSIIAHLYLAWIHPFGDGNGRTARLLEVRFLMEAGVPSAAIASDIGAAERTASYLASNFSHGYEHDEALKITAKTLIAGGKPDAIL
jgi:Fic family protein